MGERSNSEGLVTGTLRRGSRAALGSQITKKVTKSFTSEHQPSRTTPPPEPLSDRDMTLAAIDRLTNRAVIALQPSPQPDDLPHPLVTDNNFSHYLDWATRSQTGLQAKASGPQAVLQPGVVQQANLGEALIHCLHQLDHRAKRQDRRIQELEAQLAEANRRMSFLEVERR